MTAKELGQQPAHPLDRMVHDLTCLHGLTKREAFAVAAMSNWVARYGAGTEYTEAAYASVMFADALLAELAKEQVQ